jgi:hypothetical protein
MKDTEFKDTELIDTELKDSAPKETDFMDLSQERALNEQIASLAKEEQPPNNLWPDIKVSIVKPATKYYTTRWIPWAIAASFVISLASVTYSWNHFQQAELLYAKIKKTQNNTRLTIQSSDYENSIQYQVHLLEQEFKIAKAGLLSQISMNRAHIDERLFSEIENQLTDIEQAVVLLKSAIKAQPDNSNLPRLLTSTYQQELAVLTQLAKLDTSI